MSKKQLKFYPVDNGDTTFITLSDNTSILIDCKIREGDENNSGSKIFPVKDDLLENIQSKKDNPILDLFILTHPDEDHCLGFGKNFYTGDPYNYGDENRNSNEIIVEELWVTSMVFDVASNDDAKALKKEAERRRKLWDNDTHKNVPGNRIRIIGYNGDVRYENLPNSIPGETLNLINGKLCYDIEFFVHAPFKKHLIQATAEKDKNFSSIVMQLAFKDRPTDTNWTCLFLFGGDADHNIWAEILKQSENNNNHDKMKWDILLSPHHCSWSYFNDVPYSDPEENKVPKDSSLKILDYIRPAASVIASCKVIKDNDDNPPHYQAKKQYLKKVAESEFLNTAVEPNENQPEPIVIEVTSSGYARIDIGAKAAALRSVSKGISSGLVGTTVTGKLSGEAGNYIKHQPHRFYGE